MRKAILLITVIGILLAVGSGVALAVALTGTNASETLTGTSSSDKLAGGGGGDTINAKAGDDQLFGDFGADELNAGDGADYINAHDQTNGDTINCGGGSGGDGEADTGVADPGDTIGPSCTAADGDLITQI
jgi:Ca2+-binding RTX toxin-like protein